MALKVLVTAGSASAGLFAHSKGLLGMEIGVAFALRRMDVHLLVSADTCTREADFVYGTTFKSVSTFDDAESHDARLTELTTAFAPDVIVASAITYRHALSTIRRHCGSKTHVVMCVSMNEHPTAGEIVAVRSEILKHGHDLALIADLRDQDYSRHGIMLVTPEGGAFPCGDVRAESADAIADFILRRHGTVSVPVVSANAVTTLFPEHDAYRVARKLLSFTQDANVFHGSSGNLSARVSPRNDMIVSPTGVEKSTMRDDELVHVEPDRTEKGVLLYYGDRRPSIDSSLQARLYEALPKAQAFLHLHADAGVFMEIDAAASFPYPCGTAEEAEDVARVLAEKKIDGGKCFSVLLVHHGYLLGFEPNGVNWLLHEWRMARGSFVNQEGVFQPIFVGGRIAGAVKVESRGKPKEFAFLPGWGTDARIAKLHALCGS